MDSEIECRFTGLWYNGAYSQAINFIERWDNKMLSPDSFAHLLEFLLVSMGQDSFPYPWVFTVNQ